MLTGQAYRNEARQRPRRVKRGFKKAHAMERNVDRAGGQGRRTVRGRDSDHGVGGLGRDTFSAHAGQVQGHVGDAVVAHLEWVVGDGGWGRGRGMRG